MISNFIVAFIAFALFFGPVIGALEPVDRVIVIDVKKDSPSEAAGFHKGMVVLGSNSKTIAGLDELFLNLQKGSQIKVLQDNQESNLNLASDAIKGIMVGQRISINNDVGTMTLSDKNGSTTLDALRAKLAWSDTTSTLATQYDLILKSDASHNHTLDGLSNVLTTGKASGNVIKWNGTNWVDSTDESGASSGDGQDADSINGKPISATYRGTATGKHYTPVYSPDSASGNGRLDYYYTPTMDSTRIATADSDYYVLSVSGGKIVIGNPPVTTAQLGAKADSSTALYWPDTSLLIGKHVFTFDPAINLGCCGGARTSTASVGMVADAAKSNVPMLGYTVPYAVSNTLLTLWGMVIVLLID